MLCVASRVLVYWDNKPQESDSTSVLFLFWFFFPPAAFLTQTVCLDDTTVKFEIWDTAGQERYHSLAPMYYRGAQAAIVVYDITNEVSRRLKRPRGCILHHASMFVV